MRSAKFSITRPTRWQPETVRNPDSWANGAFTDDTAWDLIASRLEAGEPVEEVALRKPPGAKGYVMKISLGPDVCLLYVKLQLGPKKVFGRSFHCDEPGSW